MKSTFLECPNCSTKIPIYAFRCGNCKYIVRERVVNIDLWATIEQLIVAPKNAFENIMFAEIKNYVFYLTFLIPIKFLLLGMLLMIHWKKMVITFSASYVPAAIIGGAIIIVVIALVLQFFRRLTGVAVRFWDIYAAIAYSFIPLVFSFLILLSLEFVVFGSYLFTIAPGPFDIKPLFGWLFLGLEALFLLWSLFLTFKGIAVVVRSYLFSFLFSLFIYALFLLIPLFVIPMLS